MQSNRHRTHVSNSKDKSDYKREKKIRTGKARSTTQLLIFDYCLSACVCVHCESICPFQASFLPSNSHVCYSGKRGISRAYTHPQSQRNAFNLPKVFACITEMFACVCMSESEWYEPWQPECTWFLCTLCTKIVY